MDQILTDLEATFQYAIELGARIIYGRIESYWPTSLGRYVGNVPIATETIVLCL